MDALDLEAYEERRRKWRRSGFWRGVLLTIAVLIGIAVLGRFLLDTRYPVGPHIAQFDVTGVIYDDPERARLLADLAENEDALAVIVYIDSGGGTTAGSEELYEALRAVAAEKRIVAVMGGAAASGGYLTAIAADHVIARNSTITGSIGTIMEYPDLTALLDRIGVEMEVVRSSPVKGEPSPFRETVPLAREYDEALIEDSHDWFRGIVGERRGLSGDALDEVANGRVFTGRMALDRGLIDQIGGREQALDWLESQDPDLAGLDVRVWSLPEPPTGWIGLLSRAANSAAALTGLGTAEGPRLMSIYK